MGGDHVQAPIITPSIVYFERIDIMLLIS